MEASSIRATERRAPRPALRFAIAAATTAIATAIAFVAAGEGRALAQSGPHGAPTIAPSLTVIVPFAVPPGFAVQVDGAPFPEGACGKPYPIDPGHHTIDARAPGRRPWGAAVDLGVERDAQAVTVPPPLPESAAAPIPPPPTAGSFSAPPSPAVEPATRPAPGEAPPSAPGAEPSPHAWMAPTGWTLGGAGVLALGLGAAFGVEAVAKNSHAKAHCSLSACTDPGAVGENDDAKFAATIADIAIGGGLAAVAVGAYLLIAAPPSTAVASRASGAPAGIPRPPARAALRIWPMVGPERFGLALRAAF